eukprot:11896-Heterococcus_DN1.PRE.1
MIAVELVVASAVSPASAIHTGTVNGLHNITSDDHTNACCQLNHVILVVSLSQHLSYSASKYIATNH